MGNECCAPNVSDNEYPAIGSNSTIVTSLRKDPASQKTIATKHSSKIGDNTGMDVSRPSLLNNVLGTKNKCDAEFGKVQVNSVASKNPFQFAKSKNIYEGEWSNQEPHGKGKLYFTDGRYFEGTFVKGVANGRGRMIFPDSSFYDGDIVDNCAQGQGVYGSSHLRYKGGFHQSKFQGQGTQISQGLVFDGEFKAGKKVKGVLKWGNGYQYIGSFDQEGHFTGKGTLKSRAGVYEGQFLKGEKHGKGVYTTANNLKYDGHYQAGAKSGEGTFYNSDGSISYQGSWKNDLPNGKGRTYKHGIAGTETQWIDGICRSDINKVQQTAA